MADEDVPRCGSIFKCVFWSVTFLIILVVMLIVYVCFALLLVWIILRTNAVKFQVQDAELTQFNLDHKNKNLDYNLSLNFVIRNTKNSVAIQYHRFEAMVYYIDQQLGVVTVPSFNQGRKNTTVLETLFVGQKLVQVDGNGHKKFEDDRKIGVYKIDVRLKIRWRIMIFNMKPVVRCHLKAPLGSSNSSGGFDFQSTKCRVDC